MEKLIFHCFCLIFSVAEISLQLYIVSAWIMCDFKHVFLMEWSKYVSARRGHSMLTNISKTSSRVSSTPNSFDTNGIKADVWWIIPVIITSICRDPRLSLSVYTCKHEKKKKKKAWQSCSLRPLKWRVQWRSLPQDQFCRNGPQIHFMAWLLVHS